LETSLYRGSDYELSLIEKMYSFIILLAVIVGISIGQVELIQTNVEIFIVPLLVAMLYITFLQIPIDEIKKAFKNIKFTYTSCLSFNFWWYYWRYRTRIPPGKYTNRLIYSFNFSLANKNAVEI